MYAAFCLSFIRHFTSYCSYNREKHFFLQITDTFDLFFCLDQRVQQFRLQFSFAANSAAITESAPRLSSMLLLAGWASLSLVPSLFSSGFAWLLRKIPRFDQVIWGLLAQAFEWEIGPGIWMDDWPRHLNRRLAQAFKWTIGPGIWMDDWPRHLNGRLAQVFEWRLAQAFKWTIGPGIWMDDWPRHLRRMNGNQEAFHRRYLCFVNSLSPWENYVIFHFFMLLSFLYLSPR